MMSMPSGRFAARRHRPHHVGKVRWIDVLIDDDNETRHVAVRRGDQCRTFGVAIVTLAQRHHRHQLRYVLPGADYVGHTAGLKIAPDAGGAQRRPKWNRGGFIGGEPSRIGSLR